MFHFFLGDVEADHFAGGTDRLGRDERVDAEATAEVEHVLARLQFGQVVRTIHTLEVVSVLTRDFEVLR